MNGKLLFVLLGVLIVTQLSTASKSSGNNMGSSGNYGSNGQNGQVIEEKTVIVTKTQGGSSGYGNAQDNPGYGSEYLLIAIALKQVLGFFFITDSGGYGKK